MRKITGTLTLVTFLMLVTISIVFAEDYRLGPGDVLNISVWGYQDLQIMGIEIRPDGKVAFPLVGDIQADGLSPAMLAESLRVGLNDYVKNPKVTVNVQMFRTTRVYVLGEVVKPGLYELAKRHNVLDAIGIAGGYTKYAAKKEVFVIRRDQTGPPLKVNLLNLVKKGDITQNYVLGDGDVVYLTDNGKINFATDILPWITAGYYMDRTN